MIGAMLGRQAPPPPLLKGKAQTQMDLNKPKELSGSAKMFANIKSKLVGSSSGKNGQGFRKGTGHRGKRGQRFSLLVR